MKHKHAELIKAWADGAKIQVKYTDDPDHWEDRDHPIWHPEAQYRIKPEPKPDEVRFYRLWHEGAYWSDENMANVKATFDGETGVLKSADAMMKARDK